jgi:predicted homoserine dehydrogenase-like protein
VPNTVARAVLLGDATIAPAGPPRVEVVATAKVNLAPGTELDRIGGYLTYGLCENAAAARAEGLLPLGVAEGVTVKRAVRQGEVLRYTDVTLPADRLSDRLRREQETLLGAA